MRAAARQLFKPPLNSKLVRGEKMEMVSFPSVGVEDLARGMGCDVAADALSYKDSGFGPAQRAFINIDC